MSEGLFEDVSADAIIRSVDLSTTSTPSVTGAGRQKGTFMGLQLDELRSNTELAQHGSIEDFIVEPKAGLFRARTSVEKLQIWSKAALDAPITGVDKGLTKRALKCFRNLQRIMGDRRYGIGKRARTGKGPQALDLETLLSLVEVGLHEDSMRDELYLHVRKQLRSNPRPSSILKGWGVLCVYAASFPPSKFLLPLFLTEISAYEMPLTTKEQEHYSSHSDMEDPEIVKGRISLMASFIRRKIERIARTGPRIHIPTLEELENTLESPFKQSIFGVTLEEIMRSESNRAEGDHYPKILSFLAEAVLKLHGCSTEGIFRVPGFLDEVQMLRLRLERGEYTIEGIHDPSTPASLLKLWLRELAEPLVPDIYYERCLVVGSDVEEAIRLLDELPDVNRNTLKYLIKFLQVVGDPRYQSKTKMTISNLAMVFAPNILRCPSDNPLVILANSKFEQNFLKTLINYLEE